LIGTPAAGEKGPVAGDRGQGMDIAARLQRLEDERAINDAIHAYAYHFDRNEPEAVAALFTDDAEIDYGPEFPAMRGRNVFAPAIARGLAERFAATSHHISNVTVTHQGEGRARSVCYVYAWHRYRGGEPEGELWAQYHHEWLRTPDGWKIARLVLKAAGTRDFHRSRMHPIGRRQDG
jgi:ketosteroid isomerase-like protein